jgi:DNA-directed RNA polymerase specialized sigma24 family protein
MERVFTRQGLGYVMQLPALATELSIAYVRRSRGETHGELTVTCGLPGTRSADGHLHQATFNISGSEARNRLAKTLALRANTGDEIDWTDVLEDLCRRVLGAEREGEPVAKVGALPTPVAESFRLVPFLPEDQVTILYGDGGVGKSTLASAFAVSVETGVAMIEGWTPRKARVLYLDWEAGRNSLNRRVRGVAMGLHLPRVAQIDYLDCRRRGPLHGFAEHLAMTVDREHYGLVIVDSVGMAAGIGTEGGDANESALRLFSAFGYLGTTVLAIDHVNRSDAEADRKRSRPYGSIYKSLLARSTWELRLSRSSDVGQVMGLYNTKVNDSDMHAPVSLRVVHGEDGSISYEQMDSMPLELSRSLTLEEQVASALASLGHLTPAEIADELELAENKVRAVLSRYKARFNKLPSGKWEVLSRAG